MKKVLGLALVAAALTVAAPQQASAWQTFKFGVGMNLEWSSGNNSWWCGKLYNNGAMEGGGGMPGYGPGPSYGPDFGFHGDYGMAPFHGPAHAQAAPPAAPAPANGGGGGAAPVNPASLYHFANYQTTSYQY